MHIFTAEYSRQLFLMQVETKLHGGISGLNTMLNSIPTLQNTVRTTALYNRLPLKMYRKFLFQEFVWAQCEGGRMERGAVSWFDYT